MQLEAVIPSIRRTRFLSWPGGGRTLAPLSNFTELSAPSQRDPSPSEYIRAMGTKVVLRDALSDLPSKLARNSFAPGA